MKITLPFKNDNSPYSRIELERWVRENIYLPHKHMGLMKLAALYNIHSDCYSTASSCLLIHFCLDRMRDQSGGSGEILCVYEKMGLTSVPNRTRANSEGVKKYKIKLNGIEFTGRDTGQFMYEFELKLADFIKRGWAMIPSDGEGINIENLNRLLGNPNGTYLDPPKVSFVPIVVSIPDQTISSPIEDPSKKARVKRIDISMELANLKSDVEVHKEKLERADNRIEAIENRLTNVEYNLSKVHSKLPP